eukprot:8939309-Heterocapsa_arctica.AAC.1
MPQKALPALSHSLLSLFLLLLATASTTAHAHSPGPGSSCQRTASLPRWGSRGSLTDQKLQDQDQ